MAEENKRYTEQKAEACSLPRTNGNENDEEFIKFIEKEYNISRDDENVYVQYNENGTTSVAVINNDKEATIFTSPTLKEMQILKEYNENSRSIVWTGIVMLYNAYKVGKFIKTCCEVIEPVIGENVCDYITNQIIDHLVESGNKEKVRVIRHVEKKPCPYPPHSQYCNEPPYAYWRTTVERY